ncbi:hypothetical protein [Achromobacter deleyi]|uniref:hypothetical protein n=1 Tax=Achromobacter deleyi TaxID=1353891 RepID=UPI001E2CD24E|nr:hypothetical protein [Achromobacter deleyi]
MFIVKLMERTLGDSLGFHILRAQHGTGEEAKASACLISEWFNPEGLADGCERELTGLLVTNILRGRPRLRDLSDRFDVPKSNIGRPAPAYRVLVEGARRAALKRLDVQMCDADIVVDLERIVRPTALDNVGQDMQSLVAIATIAT